MTVPIGGKRLRLIHLSVLNKIKDGMEILGYLDDGWPYRSVTVTDEPFDASEEILPNKVCISGEPLQVTEWEMGSNLQGNSWTFYIDIFAEDEGTGIQMQGDIFDLVRGKFSAISTYQGVEVLDYTQATPTHLFYCDIDNVDTQRPRLWTKQYNQFWFQVNFETLDTYGDDENG